MFSTFTKIAALSAVLLGSGVAGTMVSGADRDRVYVRIETDRPALRDSVGRMQYSVDRMVDAVNSYGPDNFGRLRSDVYQLRDSTYSMETTLDQRRDIEDIRKGFYRLRGDLEAVDYRMNTVNPTRDLRDSWDRVHDAFHEVEDRMR